MKHWFGKLVCTPALLLKNLRIAAWLPVLMLILVQLVGPAGFASDAIEESGDKLVEEPVIAFAARLVGDEKRARLIVDFNRALEAEVYTQSGPDRVYIDLPETLFSLSDESQELPSSAVETMRFGAIPQARSRIILSLKSPVAIEKYVVKRVSGGARYRLIVDMVGTTAAAFAQSVRKPLKADKADEKTSAKRFTLVIDPGHGGIDGGATGQGGTREKLVTLEFALKLKAELEKDPKYRVLLTREGDQFVPLKDRLAFTRDSKADLMISIHADSLRQSRIRGATVYTLSEEGSDDLSRALAKKQNRADLIAGLELPVEKPKVVDILIDLTRRESEAFSARFAQLLVSHMKPDIKLIKNPHRSADFFVLKAPEVPSILLELGYLSNEEDEALMRSEKWQTVAVQRARKAIEAFFAPRMAEH